MKAFVKIRRTAGRPLLLCLLFALSGCFGLNRGAPAPRHYVLGGEWPAEDGGAVAAPAARGAVIGLRLPRLASYLASPFIVVREGSHRVGFSEFHRWGEELGRGVDRTLARRLTVLLPAHRMESTPWSVAVQPDYLIEVQLLRFEGVVPPTPVASGGEVHLLAAWEVLGPRDEVVLGSGTTEVRSGGWTPEDFDGLVRLLDAALDRLAEDLARELERLVASAEAGGVT